MRRHPGPSARQRVRRLAPVAALGLTVASAHAVLFLSTGDPTYNTTAPEGALTNSGWQFQGAWGDFLGTPVAPRYFLTAKHCGGSIGQPFTFRGVTYPVTAGFADPASDLALWRICGEFPEFAPLYAGTNEPGAGLVVFGRGTQRGEPLVLTPAATTNGWLWGPSDRVQRWGENTVAAVVDLDAETGSSGLGQVLIATFDLEGGTNECHLSGGDSGGAAFILDAGTWKLAAIHYAVDGPFSLSTNGPGFEAALYDQRGLFGWTGSAWEPVESTDTNQPSAFYSTRISSNLAWINSILSQPLPPETRPVLQQSPDPAARYVDLPEAVADDDRQTLSIALPGQTAFFRLRGCVLTSLEKVEAVGDRLVFHYALRP